MKVHFQCRLCLQLKDSTCTLQQVQKGKDTSSMMAESFDCVTIFYGEIVGLDKLISDYNEADEVRGKGMRYLLHTLAIKS